MRPDTLVHAARAATLILITAAALTALLWYIFTLIETPVYRLASFFLLGILFSNIAAKTVNTSTRRI